MAQYLDSNGKEKFLVLDGGLGTELTRAGFKIDDDPLWSTRTIIENSEAVKAVHKSFLESGANIVITATYQLSYEILHQYCGFDENKALDVIYRSVKIAQEACLEVKREELHRNSSLLLDCKVAKDQGISYGVFKEKMAHIASGIYVITPNLKGECWLLDQ